MNKQLYEELYKKLTLAGEESDNKELFNDLIDKGLIDELKYNKIKELIGEEVKKQGIRPYQVFGDKEVLTLLFYKPISLDKLEGLKGFPKDGARVTKYGERIVNIFNGKLEGKGNMSFF